MNEIGIKRVGNWFGTVLEIVLNRGTKAPRSADKSALEKTVSCRARAFALAAAFQNPAYRTGLFRRSRWNSCSGLPEFMFRLKPLPE